VSAVRQRISTGYEPRPLQARLHDSLRRFNVLVAHRRFGKTVFCVNSLNDAALRCKKKDGRFAYIGPFFNQTKDIAWSYLKHYAMPVPGTEANESELRVDYPNGARVRLYGADNPDRLRGIYLDGVVLDEYADMDPRMWAEVILPTLTDRGGWAIFIGTPKGKNGFWDVYQRAREDDSWFTAMYRASETGLIPPPELVMAAKEMSEDQYAQEFECSFEAAIQGSYYGKLLTALDGQKRVRSVAWEPKTPVHTAWDLGIGDSTAIWFVQQVGNEVRLIDYLENSGVGLSWYANELLSRKALGYVYGEHILPHDAEVKELGTGVSRVETLRSLGINPRVLPIQSVDDGINAARLLLARCWFDAEKCKRGLEALRQYRREYDEKLKAFKQRPLHDWCSHAADAFRYLALGLKPDEGKMKPIVYPKGGIV
jgi:hypothetical protein